MKRKKLISIVLMIAFVFSTYSVAFANVSQETTKSNEFNSSLTSDTAVLERDQVISVLIQTTDWTKEELEVFNDEQLNALFVQESTRNPAVGLVLRLILTPETIAKLIELGLWIGIVIGEIEMDAAPVEEVAVELKRNTDNKYFYAKIDYNNKKVLVANAVPMETAVNNIRMHETLPNIAPYNDINNYYTFSNNDAKKLCNALSGYSTGPEIHQDLQEGYEGQYYHWHPLKSSNPKNRYDAHIFVFNAFS